MSNKAALDGGTKIRTRKEMPSNQRVDRSPPMPRHAPTAGLTEDRPSWSGQVQTKGILPNRRSARSIEPGTDFFFGEITSFRQVQYGGNRSECASACPGIQGWPGRRHPFGGTHGVRPLGTRIALHGWKGYPSLHGSRFIRYPVHETVAVVFRQVKGIRAPVITLGPRTRSRLSFSAHRSIAEKKENGSFRGRSGTRWGITLWHITEPPGLWQRTCAHRTKSADIGENSL